MSRPHRALWLHAVAGSLALGLACAPTDATAGTLRGADAQPIGDLDGATLFAPAPVPWAAPLSDAAALGRVAADTLRYLYAAAPEPTQTSAVIRPVAAAAQVRPAAARTAAHERPGSADSEARPHCPRLGRVFCDSARQGGGAFWSLLSGSALPTRSIA